MPKVKQAALDAAKNDLPPGWEAREMKGKGKIVYINHATRTTQWEKPTISNSKKAPKGKTPAAARPAYPMMTSTPNARGGATAAAAAGGSKVGGGGPLFASASSSEVVALSSPLPAGWESKIIDGKVVYIDHANQRTTYERPTTRGASSYSAHGSVRSGRMAAPSTDPKYASNASVVSSAVGDSPLPPGWGRSATANGEVYYVNHVSKSTTWARPQWPSSEVDGDDEYESLRDGETVHTEASVKSSRSTRNRRADVLGKAVESAQPPLPPGWEERMSAEGKVFFINHNDKSTHWHRPDPPPVQPDDSPDDDVPPSETLAARHRELASSSFSSANHTPGPTGSDDGGAAVSEYGRVGGLAAFSGDSPALEDSSRRAATAEEAAAAEDEDEDEDGDDLKGGLSNATEVADVESAFLEGITGASGGSPGETGGVDTDPKRAPSATVVDIVAGADVGSSAAAVAGRKEMPRALEGAEESTTDNDGAGPVSSVVKLFGGTVAKGGSGHSRSGSESPTQSVRSKWQPLAPVYASSSAAATATGAASAGRVKPEPEPEPEPEPVVAPLPKGWMELKTAEGKTYYQNSVSKITQWERPQPATTSASPLNTATCNSTASVPVRGAAAEAGWEKVMTPEGQPYYQNSITKMTSWLPPDGWVEPRVPASSEAETAVAGHGRFFTGDDAAVEPKRLGLEATTETGAVAPTPIGRAGRGASFESSSRNALPRAEAQEVPLPPGWEKLYTDDGVPFWTNHNEKTTSWDPPLPVDTTTVVGVVSEAKGFRQNSQAESEAFESAEGAAEVVAVGTVQTAARNLGADGGPLPEGWEMQRTDQGIPYYIDHVNKRTSWDPPLMSSGGMSVIKSELPDIPPAELVPDSADLYIGADLLNRFFRSWMGDASGKSPLEAARHVIVTYLTGPGLKVTKGRNASNLQRYLYLSPTNKQVVWATKPTSKGKLSKKGLTLDNITKLEYKDGGIRVEARGESSPLILESAAVESLTSEGATILLGVLLADMTGAMLKLEGVSGDSGSCYYPASFVNKVLEVREARAEKNTALAAAAATSQHQTQSSNGASNGGASARSAKTSNERAVVAKESVTPTAASPEPQGSERSASQPSTGVDGVSGAVPTPSEEGATAAAAAATASWDRSLAGSLSPRAAATSKATVATRHAPEHPSPSPKASSTSKDSSALEPWSTAKPVSVAAELRAAERKVTAAGGKGAGAGVAASYMAHLSKGSQKALKVATTTTTAASGGTSAINSNSVGSGQEKVAGANGGASAASIASNSYGAEWQLVSGEDVLPAERDAGEAVVASVVAASSTPAKEVKAEVVSEPVAAAPVEAPREAAAVSSVVASRPVVKEEPAAVGTQAAEEAAAEEADAEAEEEEMREYRRVLTEMLRPVKMEKYVENFLSSGITLDILPLVERGDLQSEVGITGAVPQLKIMKAIKTRFPNGV